MSRHYWIIIYVIAVLLTIRFMIIGGLISYKDLKIEFPPLPSKQHIYNKYLTKIYVNIMNT